MSFSDKIRGLLTGGANGNSTVALEEPISGAVGIESIASAELKPVPKEKPTARLRGPEVDGREEGIPGTPNLAGFIRDLGEYNPQLDALNGIRTYEKMRRQDPTVAALEAAVRLPIRAAEWSIEPGADKSEPGRALAKEIAAMVEENLFSGLERETSAGKHTQTFESVIENALLCAPLGVSGHEDLWEIDTDKGGVRLKRLAPRLPITFYQFIIEPDGETLQTLIQFGYRGAEVNLFPVPANKLTLFTFNREGANFYGRSMLRPAYQPWYFKSRLMVIDSIGAEKNRLAVPTIIQGPSASPDDVQKSWTWAQNLAANERTCLSLPNQWEFKQVGIEGRAIQLTDMIRYYDEQIADAGLGGFLSLGKTATGSRALGDVKMDFFLLAENALAKMVADAITFTSIRRLVDFNYKSKPGESLPYPKLCCSNILMVNALDVANAVKELSSANVGWLETSEERDNAMAQKLGLPPINGKPRPKFAPVMRQIREVEQGNEAIPDESAPKAPEEATPKGGEKRDQVDVRNPGSAKAVKGEREEDVSLADHPGLRPPLLSEAGNKKPNRELKAFEKKHDFVGHAKRADITARQVARVLRRAKPAAIREAARLAAGLQVSQLGELQLPFDRVLAARIEALLKTAHRYSRDQVYAERYRATRRGKNASGTPALRASEMADSPKRDSYFIAEASLSDYNNWLTARARGAAVDAIKQGIGSGEQGIEELEQAIENNLLEGSDGQIDRIGDEAGREAVAAGRADALEELQSEIELYIRSEAMDGNTCDPCIKGDGTEWKSFDAIDWTPGDDCEGGDACRGQVIPVFEGEGTVVLG